MLSLLIELSPKKKEDGIVIGSYEDYQKLLENKKYLMPLIETNNRLDFIFVEAQYFFPV